MKKVLVLVFVVAVVLVIAYLHLHNFTDNTKTDLSSIKKADETPLGITNVDKEGLAPGRFIDAFVTKVVDGDTIDVTYKGEKHRVRLLDMDTPESVKQGVTVQPYAKEASNFTRNMALGQSVRLVFESKLEDPYGRLLAHVILKDGTYLNALLVRNGFARAEVLAPNLAYKDYFYGLQEKAINDKAGLWGLSKDKQPFIKGENGLYIPRYLENQ